MKNIFFGISCLLSLSMGAVIHHIGVDGCSFNPPVQNSIQLGDTIHWYWDANSPRRSSSMNIPPGATAWDVLLQNDSKDFYYVPAVTGQYFYKSNILPTCVASFSVSGPLGISALQKSQTICAIFPNPAKLSFLLIHPKNASSIEFFDLEGKLVKEESLDLKETNDEILLNGLKAGNYLVNVKQKSTVIYTSKLIVVE